MTITVHCFIISQRPEQKTDYHQVIPHDTAEGRAYAEVLWRLHRALAGNPPPQVLLGFPLAGERVEDGAWCLCRGQRERSRSGRTYLRLQALVLPAAALAALPLNPLALYYQESLWTTTVRPRMQVEVTGEGMPRENLALDEQVHALLRAGGGIHALARPAEELIAAACHALQKLAPDEWARTSIAIGLPEGTSLPDGIRSPLALQPAPAEPVSAPPPPKPAPAAEPPAPVRYAGLLARSQAQLLESVTRLEGELGTALDDLRFNAGPARGRELAKLAHACRKRLRRHRALLRRTEQQLDRSLRAYHYRREQARPRFGAPEYVVVGMLLLVTALVALVVMHQFGYATFLDNLLRRLW